jgi:hypothetical protein
MSFFAKAALVFSGALFIFGALAMVVSNRMPPSEARAFAAKCGMAFVLFVFFTIMFVRE